MLDKLTLARINDRPRGRGVAPYAALGTLAVAAGVGVVSSYVFAAAVLVAGAAVAFLLHRRDVEARTVKLRYDLEGEAAERFAAVRAACEALSGAGGIWRTDGDRASREPAEVGLLDTPGFSANVDVWGIRAGDVSLFFLPECVLSHEQDRYRAVSYGSFGAIYESSRMVEDGDVPGDAEIIGETWRYVNADGTPDHRRASNPRYPLVSYGLLSVSGGAGRLLVSNKAAAVRFARAFGAGKDEEHRRGASSSARAERARRNAIAEEERSGSLFKVLGVKPGASRAEVSAAYKKMARMYHPDRVATLDLEVREMAELRMKEINAAYGELKRHNV